MVRAALLLAGALQGGVDPETLDEGEGGLDGLRGGAVDGLGIDD